MASRLDSCGGCRHLCHRQAYPIDQGGDLVTSKRGAIAEGLAVPVVMLAPIAVLNMVFEQADFATYGQIMYAHYWFWGLVGADVLTGIAMTTWRLRRPPPSNTRQP